MLDEHLQPFILEVNTGPNLWLDDKSTANQATIKGAFAPWLEYVIFSVLLVWTTYLQLETCFFHDLLRKRK